MYVARHAFVRSVHPERELTMPQRAAKPSLLVDALLFAAGAVVATVLLLALANPFAQPDSTREQRPPCAPAPPRAAAAARSTMTRRWRTPWTGPSRGGTRSAPGGRARTRSSPAAGSAS